MFFRTPIIRIKQVLKKSRKIRYKYFPDYCGFSIFIILSKKPSGYNIGERVKNVIFFPILR